MNQLGGIDSCSYLSILYENIMNFCIIVTENNLKHLRWET